MKSPTALSQDPINTTQQVMARFLTSMFLSLKNLTI